jgi:hypothetical protein
MVGVLFHGVELPEIKMISPANSFLPGVHFTLTVVVDGTNKDGKLQLPEGWSSINSLKMEREQGYSYFFSLKSDPQLGVGKYTLRYVLADDSYHQSIDLTISPVQKIEVLPVSLPTFAQEEDSLRFSYLVKNDGNLKELIYYSSCQGPGDSLSLMPGESKLISWLEDVPEGASEYQHRMDLLYGGIYHNYYHQIPVFLKKMPGKAREETWPLKVGIRWFGYTPGRNTIQIFAEGAGYFGPKKEHFVDILLRGPNQTAFPMFGFYDQYSVSYAYKNSFGFQAGDFVNRLTPLVEAGRFGRGVRVWFPAGKSKFTIFYHQPRFFNLQKDAWGAEWSTVRKKSSFSVLNFNKRFMARNTWDYASILSGTYRFEKSGLHLAQEAALSTSRGKVDMGLFSKLMYSRKNLSFNYQGSYSGKNFYGYYSNSRFSSAHITYKVLKKYYLGVQHYYSRLQLLPDLHEFYISPIYHFQAAHFTAQPSSNHLLNVYFQRGERKDSVAAYHFKENFLGVNYSVNARRFRLDTQVRQGSTANLLSEDQRFQNLTTAYVQSNFRFWNELWLGPLAEFQNTSRFSNATENLFFWGGQIQYNSMPRWNVSANYRSSFAQDQVFKQQSLLQIQANTYIGPHTFSLQGGKTYYPTLDGSGLQMLHFNFSYAYTIGMPSKKREAMGRVKGQVQVSGDNHYMLYLGDRKFMTDESGKFDFGKVRVGTYQMQIKSRLPGSLHPDTLTVVVNAGANDPIVVPTYRASSIRGVVKGAYPSKTLIHCEGAGQLQTIRLKENGTFAFLGLKPGQYTLSISVPDDQVAEPLALEIKEGEERTVGMEVKVKERKIYFQSAPLQVKP